VSQINQNPNDLNEDDPGFFVLISMARLRIEISKIVTAQQKKLGTGFVTNYHSITQCEGQPFFWNESISIKNENNDVVTWDMTCCREIHDWRVYGGIFVSRHDLDYEIEIHSFLENDDLKSSKDLLAAFEYLVSEVKTSIESRDISSWVELSKT
jgi:hypothetical protein